MIAVVQRVKSASVKALGNKPVTIGRGFVALVGVKENDTSAEAIKLGKKLSKLRLMPDQTGKLNLTLATTGGELLLVSQFTLIADIKSGNRPSFAHAATGDKAEALFAELITTCRQFVPVKTGFFGQQMTLELSNDGPVTLVLDTEKF